MNTEFITEGLRDDRYLKADKLVYRFEEEIQQAIQEVCNEVIEANNGLFDDDVSFDERVLAAGATNTLATIRTEFRANRENSEGDTLKLNIALEWVDPEEQGEAASLDGSLCYVLYKIQHGSDARFEAVRRRTNGRDDWDGVRFGEDQWYHWSKHAPGIVYIPVEDGSQIREGLQTLQDHFSSEYAPELREL